MAKPRIAAAKTAATGQEAAADDAAAVDTGTEGAAATDTADQAGTEAAAAGEADEASAATADTAATNAEGTTASETGTDTAAAGTDGAAATTVAQAGDAAPAAELAQAVHQMALQGTAAELVTVDAINQAGADTLTGAVLDTYTVCRPLDRNQKAIPVGDPVLLSREEAEPLLKLGVISLPA